MIRFIKKLIGYLWFGSLIVFLVFSGFYLGWGDFIIVLAVALIVILITILSVDWLRQ